jgi:hypothetical protein
MYRRFVISYVATPEAYFLGREHLHTATLLLKVPRLGAESTTACLQKALKNAFDATVRLVVLVVLVRILVIVVVVFAIDVLVICNVLRTE